MKLWQPIPLILTAFSLSPLPPSVCADSSVKRPAAGQNQRKGPDQAKVPASWSGCIDQGEAGRYVLVDDGKLSPLVELQADGFANEGFAKFLGQKVKVQGRRATVEGRDVVTVRKIEMVSETCTPARPSPDEK